MKEAFNHPSNTPRIVVERKIDPRFAYILHAPLGDPARLEETVAVNRGMILKVFENPEDAIEWLAKPGALIRRVMLFGAPPTIDSSDCAEMIKTSNSTC